jgi:glycosyltransferase involved in cell wall biosynthesis
MMFLLIAGFPDSLLHFRGPLIQALMDCDMKIHVAAPDLPEGSEQRVRLEAKGLIVHSIPLLRTGMNPFADLKTLFALWSLMRSIRADFVLSYTIKPVIYGSIAAWLAGVQHRFALITGLGYAFQGDGRRGMLRNLVQGLYAIALRTTHKVFFQNHDDEALFRTKGIFKSAVPSVVLNGSGVDVSAFDVVPLPTEPVFLLIARLLGDKGVREYVEAAREVRRTRADVKFLLVGWIDENPDAIRQDELDAWVQEGVVEFLGRMVDVRPTIAKASVYVLPSYREGTPRTVLEAMAMGRAIITTDAPGCRETVIDGVNGFLVSVREVAPLVAAMRLFLDSPGLLVEMGQQSRAIVVEKFDVHKVNSVMLKEMGIRC